MTRTWNASGIDAAISALNAVLAPDKNLGDDDKIAAHLDDLERDGSTEVSFHRTRSRRPEVVQADPAWFDLAERPADAIPCDRDGDGFSPAD